MSLLLAQLCDWDLTVDSIVDTSTLLCTTFFVVKLSVWINSFIVTALAVLFCFGLVMSKKFLRSVPIGGTSNFSQVVTFDSPYFLPWHVRFSTSFIYWFFSCDILYVCQSFLSQLLSLLLLIPNSPEKILSRKSFSVMIPVLCFLQYLLVKECNKRIFFCFPYNAILSLGFVE